MEIIPRTALRGPNASEASLAISRAIEAPPRAVFIQPLFTAGRFQHRSNATTVSNTYLLMALTIRFLPLQCQQCPLLAQRSSWLMDFNTGRTPRPFRCVPFDGFDDPPFPSPVSTTTSFAALSFTTDGFQHRSNNTTVPTRTFRWPRRLALSGSLSIANGVLSWRGGVLRSTGRCFRQRRSGITWRVVPVFARRRKFRCRRLIFTISIPKHDA